jgi:hypothetical protein
MDVRDVEAAIGTLTWTPKCLQTSRNRVAASTLASSRVSVRNVAIFQGLVRRASGRGTTLTTWPETSVPLLGVPQETRSTADHGMTRRC